jgi:hypothetical protein
MNPLIPAPVPVPLPAPVWLLQFLSVFTFILHLLLMNCLVGGVVLLCFSAYRGQNDLQHRELVRRVAPVMPAVVSFTITFGVAPLLFLQLVYGQLFYTSSVLMAWGWLSVLFFLLIGYYGIYCFSFHQDELGSRQFWVILISAVMFLSVMVLFSRNMSFMLHPQDFYPRFLAQGAGGFLAPPNPATWARLMHVFVGALGVAGLGLALLSGAWRRESPDLAEWARRYGLRWFMTWIGVELLVGIWLLVRLPVEIRAQFMGADRLSTGILLVAVVFVVLAMLAARKSLTLGAIGLVGTLSLMAVMRQLVRVAYLRPYFDPHKLPVQGQWVVFAIFAILLVAGLATMGWMLYQLFRRASPAGATTPVSPP